MSLLSLWRLFFRVVGITYSEARAGQRTWTKSMPLPTSEPNYTHITVGSEREERRSPSATHLKELVLKFWRWRLQSVNQNFQRGAEKERLHSGDFLRQIPVESKSAFHWDKGEAVIYKVPVQVPDWLNFMQILTVLIALNHAVIIAVLISWHWYKWGYNCAVLIEEGKS